MEISLKKRIVVNKVNLKQQKNDFAYWQTQSYQTRLETLEKIRQTRAFPCACPKGYTFG